ncbi:MAG: acetylpolyamine amidohydrolase, partial [Phycisphaerae bacterium]
MLRIRRVFDDLLPIDAREISQVQQMLRGQFPDVDADEIDALPERLRNPLKYRFRRSLYVSDDVNGNVRGFALVLHEPGIRFWFLDYIAATLRGTGGGVGGTLYARVREEAAASDAIGLFFECSPDDPERVADRSLLKQNIARLRFYERFGVRPLTGNEYHAPIKAGQLDMPYLMYDNLDSGHPLTRSKTRQVVRAILERKYAEICPPDFISMVVNSFRDDPIRVRETRYHKPDAGTKAPSTRPSVVRACVALVINDKHDIHHVHDRGYVESPVRIAAIQSELALNQAYFEGLFAE